jgi:hypothetical protein
MSGSPMIKLDSPMFKLDSPRTRRRASAVDLTARNLPLFFHME